MGPKDDSCNVSRRGFAGLIAVSTVTLSTVADAQQASAPPAAPPDPNTATQRRGTIPEVPPFQESLAFTRQEVPLRIRPFAMDRVRLLDGPYQDAQKWNQDYVQRLSADRLLHNFRLNAGLPTSAEPLGGWEEPKGELRGHFTGHYLSALALLYASTGDKSIRDKGNFMVAELAKCQAKLGGGYLSAFPLEFWERLDARKTVWAPFYTIHKIMAGMYDMYVLTDNAQSLEVLTGMAGWADAWTAPKSEEHMQEILKTEYGGMNEVLYNLAAVTKDDRWAKVGDRFTKKAFFNPLASRRDELRGLHVNTHIPQVIGAARRYELSSDERFHDVADFFWFEVVSARTYVTGGTSNGEGWLVQPRQLAAELKRSVATAECCCAYNMMKLTRHLYSWSGDPRYFDYYERAMLNHRLGTIYPKTGATQYYLSLTPGTWKTFNTEDHSFWCCTGTGVEEFSKLNDSIYWRNDADVYVNLFIPSELHWTEKGVRLRQTTRFPEEPTTALTVSVDKPVPFAMHLRIPGWLTKPASIKINGKALEATASPGSYLTLSRTWKNGDKVDMEMPMTLTAEAMPDDPKLRAFLYGPIVLAGDLGSEGLTREMIVGPNAPRMQARPGTDAKNIPPALEIPAFRAAATDPASWIKPTGKPLCFRTAGQQKDLEFRPLNSIFDTRYSVYWQVS